MSTEQRILSALEEMQRQINKLATTVESMGKPMSVELLTVADAAAALGIKPATLRRKISAKNINAHKTGRMIWITTEEIDRYRRHGNATTAAAEHEAKSYLSKRRHT
jgi:excisionase family DNA binding protein